MPLYASCCTVLFKILFYKVKMFSLVCVCLLFMYYLWRSVCAQSCLTLCDLIGHSPPGSSVHGISRQEYWSVLPFSPPGHLPDPGIEPSSPVFCIAGRLLNTEPSESGQSQGLRFKFGFKLSAYLNLMAQLVKNPPAMWEIWVWSLGWEDPLEKEKATHSSILTWRISWTV